MKSFLKKLLVVTLAAVLGVSALLTMAACGNKGNRNLSFYVFAGQGDQATYTELVNAWAAQYAEKLKAEDPEQFGEDFSFKVETDFDSDPGTYFDELSKRLFCSESDPSKRFEVLRGGREAIEKLPKPSSSCKAEGYDRTKMTSSFLGVQAVPFVIAPDGRFSRGKPANLRSFLEGNASDGNIADLRAPR